MISTVTKQNVERSGTTVENTFKIKASAKAFRILSDGLYSDKITAILRELSCNAYDAQQTAKTLDKPFHIKLPNHLEPNFSIRDYGIGLSDKDVRTIFTTYFESTKTDSNDQIGCLGLGSKSPFSYTDNFTVTSYHNGKKTIYNMFLNEEEVPSVAELHSEDTDEHNGLEIGFSVKRENITEFHYKSGEVFQYFKHKPLITGHTVNIPEVKYVEKRDGSWGLRDTNNWGTPHAVMGNVAYEMKDAKFDTLTANERAVLALNIDIFFDIGEVDVSASREKLSYNNLTKKNIKDKLSKIVTELSEEINANIAKCQSLWDARVMICELSQGDMRVFRNIVDNIVVTFKGDTVLASEVTFKEDDLKTYSLTAHTFASTRRRSKERYQAGNIRYVVPRKRIKILLGDTTKNVKARITKFIETEKQLGNTNLQIISIVPVDGKSMDEAVKMFKATMGMSDDVKFDSLEALPYDKVVRVAGQNSGNYNPKNTKKVFKFNRDNTSGNADSDWWTVAEPVLDDGGIYVTIERYRINRRSPELYIRDYMNVLKAINPNDDLPVVYGVKPNELDSFDKLDNWIKLDTHTEDMVKDYLEDNNLQSMIDVRSAFNTKAVLAKSGDYYHASHREDIVTYADVLTSNVKYASTIKLIVNMGKFEEVIKNSPKIAEYAKVDSDKVIEYQKMFKEMFADLEKDYPMITLVNDFSHEKSVKMVKQYIKMMDKKSEISG